MRRYQLLGIFLLCASSLWAQESSLFVDLELSNGSELRYSLDYQEHPNLVAAFIFVAQQEPELYEQARFVDARQGAYGNPLASLPSADGLHSLPDVLSDLERETPSLGFLRTGSVLRPDLLMVYVRETRVRDRSNMVFFGSLVEESKAKAKVKLPKKGGLSLLNLDAQSDEARAFLEGLSTDSESYLEGLDRAWDAYLETTWPDVFQLVQDGDWQRDAFGYYTRVVQEGSGDIPKEGEDINITLERKAFAGQSARSLPTIVNLGRDDLPAPFSYFVSKTNKRSVLEVLSPPSLARQQMSALGQQYTGKRTRYQWLYDSYRGEEWVYLSFSLE